MQCKHIFWTSEASCARDTESLRKHFSKFLWLTTSLLKFQSCDSHWQRSVEQPRGKNRGTWRCRWRFLLTKALNHSCPQNFMIQIWFSCRVLRIPKIPHGTDRKWPKSLVVQQSGAMRTLFVETRRRCSWCSSSQPESQTPWNPIAIRNPTLWHCDLSSFCHIDWICNCEASPWMTWEKGPVLDGARKSGRGQDAIVCHWMTLD